MHRSSILPLPRPLLSAEGYGPSYLNLKLCLDLILAEGLIKGEVPLTPHDVLNAVWLTTDPDPAGHGLDDGGRAVTAWEKEALGIPADENAWFPDKRAVRITVELDPAADRRLVHWPRWGRERLDPAWYGALVSAGGAKHETWWLYWGVVPPAAFVRVEGRVQQTGGSDG